MPKVALVPANQENDEALHPLRYQEASTAALAPPGLGHSLFDDTFSKVRLVFAALNLTRGSTQR